MRNIVIYLFKFPNILWTKHRREIKLPMWFIKRFTPRSCLV